jgi:hypothetical protein
MGHELGWNDAETARQIALYDKQIEQFSVAPLRAEKSSC